MTGSTAKPPRIVAIGWGRMEIESLGRGKDFKLWPGGGRAWDWGETGTAHKPGIQRADVEELVRNGCRVIVLACGVFSRLKVADETVEYLKTNQIEFIATDTKRAVKLYNDYAERNIEVGGLCHSTC